MTMTLRSRKILLGFVSPVNTSPTYDALWPHLDHCSCNAFVSPKTGICNNKPCEHHGRQVIDPRSWPPPAEPEPEIAQQTRPEIDWGRIETLDGRIDAAAVHYHHRTGEDVDELAASIKFAIIERASQEPEFLAETNTDAYIVNLGVWRAIDRLRHENLRPIQSIDVENSPPLTAHTVDPDVSIMLAALPEDQRNLVDLLLNRGGLVRGGRVNVKGLARELGVSWRQAHNRLRSLKESLGWQATLV